jgi:hypothetical protein
MEKWKMGKKRLAVNRISRNKIIYNRILELFVVKKSSARLHSEGK